MSERCDKALVALVRCYETLAPETIPALIACYAPQARFRDPFNHVCGVDEIARIFRHMFAAVDEPRFRVTRCMRDGCEAMLRWSFHGRLRGRTLAVEGVSHVVLGEDGRVLDHRDYWDSAEGIYAVLPLIGTLVRALKRTMTAGKGGVAGWLPPLGTDCAVQQTKVGENPDPWR